MHYAGCGVKPSGHGAAELCTVMAARKEVDEPIVDFVRFIRGSHIVEQSGVPNGFKGLTDVQRYDLYIRVARQHFRDRLENGDESCCRGSSEVEGILISKAQLGRWLEKYWIDEFSDNYTLQCPAQDRRDRDGPVVGMFLRHGGLWSWCNRCQLPLFRDHRSSDGLTEQAASGPEKTRAPRHRNRAGNKFMPVAVLWSLSKIANIRISIISFSVPARLAVVSLRFGSW